MADLILELYSEEIPARFQKLGRDTLAQKLAEALKAAGISWQDVAVYSTPHRLVVSATGLPTETPNVSEERRGPRADAPEKAIEGFLRGVGLTRDQLQERETPKGSFLFAVIEKKGVKTADVIAAAMPEIISTFPWPKSQRWGAGSLKWVRPLRSILCLLDGAVVPFEVDGFKSGNTTTGHRFRGAGSFAVSDFASYRAGLEAAKVMLDQEYRKSLIAERCRTLAAEKNLIWVEDAGLLEEVAGLTEWPVPMLGAFDPDFLEVPEQVLILKMKHDQKYFVLRHGDGTLAPNFIFTADIEPADGGALVTAGNERVLSARLSDAKFFFEQDQKVTLESQRAKLKDIVFHAKLGSVYDRTERMETLARHLAEFIPGCDAAEAALAARVSKSDLVSGMVGEIAEVQGLMGGVYAAKEGKPEAVATAIKDQYSPKGPGDACPTAPVSVAVALAEKLDTLVGFFSIGEKPSGSGDPYALRRAALGVIRLMIENELPMSIENACTKIAELWKKHLNQDVFLGELFEFIADRLANTYKSDGFTNQIIGAAGRTKLTTAIEMQLYKFAKLVEALKAFIDSDDGINLLAGYKRAVNILGIEEKKDGTSYAVAVDTGKLDAAEGTALYEALAAAKVSAAKALESEDFTAAMTALAALRAPIDAFFEAVKVNADEPAVRANRLALLAEIRETMNIVADFSQIEG